MASWSGTLKDLVTLQRGTTYKSALLGTPGPKLLGLASIERNGGFKGSSLKTYGGDSPEKLLLRPGDIYVSLKDVTQAGDLIGAVSRVPSEIEVGRLTQDTVKLEFKDLRIPKDYIYWLLRTPQFRDYCKKRAIGTTNLSLRREDFLALPVSEPTEYQSRVIAILEAVERKIGLNRRMNATLEAMARALFKAWFVDFEPSRANLDNRPSTSASPEIAKLFPSDFENGIPKGWKAGTLGENFNLTMGRSPSGDTYNKDGEGEVFYQGRTDFGFRFPTPRVYCTQPSTFAEKDDTLLSVRAPVGDVNIAPNKCCIGRGIAALRHKSGSRSFTYYNLWNLASHFGNFESEGTVFGSITKFGLQNTKIVEPPREIIMKFEEVVGKLDDRIKTNSEEILTLSEIRDSLLPRLISGEIEVRQ